MADNEVPRSPPAMDRNSSSSSSLETSTAAADMEDVRPSLPASSSSSSSSSSSPLAKYQELTPVPNHQQDEGQDFEDAPDTASVRSRSLTDQAPSRPTSKLQKAEDVLEVVHSDDEDIALENAVDGADSDEGTRQARRPSASSNTNMDVVNLDDETAAAPPTDRGTTGLSFVGTDSNKLKDDEGASDAKGHGKEPTKSLSLGSIASSLPSLPWSSSQQTPSAEAPKSPNTLAGIFVASTQGAQSAQATPAPTSLSAPPPSGVPTRKISSPFAWLTRTSTQKELPQPTATVKRRDTASSVATLSSNPELMLGRLDEERDEGTFNGTNGPTRNSLRDRFKQLRKREEAGTMSEASEDDQAAPGIGQGGRGNSFGLSASGGDDELEAAAASRSAVPPLSPNPALAPGTASGVSAGPSAMSEASVDWDLWQSVVYEGPAAVARTSPEELNRAIATGIPSAIRGVIWQVLAQSKNEGLEAVYHDLSTRGTDKAKDRHSNGTTTSSISNGNPSIYSEQQVPSSSSSVHSDQSNANGIPSPKVSSEKSAPPASLKAQASAIDEKKRKERDDAAMLQKLEKIIRRDLGTRTSYSKYAAAEGLQEGLFGVCKAYALFDEGVGYAQGMNFLVMPLLFNMPEQEAFSLLVRLMNHYGLRDLFVQDMPGLHMHLYQFERMLEDLEPALYCHLHRRNISPHLYATQWFLTLFAYRFPLQLVLRIYDLILSEGLSAIIRFGLVLMQKNVAALLAMNDMQQLTTFLKDKVFDVYIDKAPSAGSILENGFFGSSTSSLDKEVYRADQLVRDACEIKMTPQALKMYADEWKEKTRAEKEREAELEDLRSSNVNFAHRVRRLEERIEAADTEHATMATEMVHTKVDNQELRDENESLKGQVRELRVVIEKQPVEIEETWKLERDDLMKRNEKVYEENQKIEKEMAELEEELVQTKMRFAELNSQYETVNRRWADLKRQFA